MLTNQASFGNDDSLFPFRKALAHWCWIVVCLCFSDFCCACCSQHTGAVSVVYVNCFITHYVSVSNAMCCVCMYVCKG